MRDELLPCPFCGRDMTYGQEPHDNPGIGSLYYVYHKGGSLGCRLDIQGHFETKEEMFEQCNHRASQWRPISEAPKDGTRILIDGETWAREDSPEIAFWDGEHWNAADISYDHDQPTHWMPLPSLPQPPEVQG